MTLSCFAIVMSALALTQAAASTASDREALHRSVLENCAADQQRFCAGKQGAEGHACMAANLPRASEACRAAIGRFEAAIPPNRSPAQTDAAADHHQ